MEESMKGNIIAGMQNKTLELWEPDAVRGAAEF
jgi:hypothetical protein